MDSLSYRIKAARNAIVTHLSYDAASFDDLANLTGLADDQLDFVLKDLQDAKEIRTVKGPGHLYEAMDFWNRVHSWDLSEYDPNRVVAVDVETTGLNVLVDDVLQAAVVEYDGDGRLNQFFGSSKPDWRQAEQVNGITPEMVNGLPRLCECPDVVSDALVGIDVIMGYNLAFDQSMLRAAGVAIPELVACCDVMYDVRDISRCTSLSRACRLFDVEAYPAHDAVNDCHNTIRLSKAVAKVVL